MKQGDKGKWTRVTVVIAVMAMTAAACALVFVPREDKVTIDQFSIIDRLAEIHPDYSGTVIPPNIAPLNFSIRENGSHYCVRISSRQGQPIEIFSRSPKIVIAEKPWHALLNANRGEDLSFLVFVRSQDGDWKRFSPVVNTIANEEIDRFLVYRRIYPVYGAWGKMGIYQRDLQGFEESVILDNDYFKGGCLNCHSFCANDPNKMLIDFRSSDYGVPTVLVENGKPYKVGTKFGYVAWHPSGRLVTYAINQVAMFFHASDTEVRDVIDLDSLLAYYLVDRKTVKTAPDIARKDRLETYPAWSPDGRYLYFCSAPLTWTQRNVIPSNYDEVKYDLVRISYDIDRDQWGKLETVLSSKDTGSSILLPRISPDGRWLVFCMCAYGCFPVYQRSSDLYIVDLEAAQKTGRYEPRRLQANSDESESWHSWSTNSRWVAFSSKRGSGVFTRSYLCYLDADGKASKPFVVPQKDPDYYDSCLWTYSVPELIRGRVRVTGEKLARVLRGSEAIHTDMPITTATPKVAAPPTQSGPWMMRE
ncbi:MAG: hypothetical protein P8Z79_03890 [Sedimentisphaerales bacterium]|jgi:Tol biopolymer transport system component